MKRKITCPVHGTLSEIEFDENPVDGRMLGIVRCSRFRPEDAVSCDELCRHRLNAKLERSVGTRDAAQDSEAPIPES